MIETESTPTTTRSRRFLATAVSIAFLVAVAAVTSGASRSSNAFRAAAATTETARVELVGHGWGHGRGLSQYGALGYVKDHGWSSEQILDHYYGNTTSGTVPVAHTPNPEGLRVELLFMSGKQTTVSLGQGVLELVATDGTVVAASSASTNSVRLIPDGNSLTARFGGGCDGPWGDTVKLDSTSVRVRAQTEGTDQTNLLQVCGPSYSVWYDGDIVSAINDGQQRTTNVVTVDQYLRGVVPNEVPAYWPAAVLEVQAVAARSYVLAGDYRFSPVADTCDTTRCQVYDGRYTTRGGWRRSTQPTTDKAVAATNSVVRLFSDGKVARTEFSSSTGGYSTGGDFPAVPDDGDDVAENPNSTWNVTITLSTVEKKYNLGPIKELAVVKRSGLGPDGGRVELAEYRFENGIASVTGDNVRTDLGLKSNWFTPGPILRGDSIASAGAESVAASPQGTQIAAESENSPESPEEEKSTDGEIFLNRTFLRLQGRQPTTDEISQWAELAETSDGKRKLAAALINTDHFAGVLIDDLYQSALGRTADDAGRAYWVAAMDDGFAYEQVGVYFYGSDEYFERLGRSKDQYVVSLYQEILGREPDAEGRDYWVDAMNSDSDNVVVAESFYRSVESRSDRSRRLYSRVLGQSPTVEQIEGLASRLLEVDDLTLAAEIAVSEGSGG